MPPIAADMNIHIPILQTKNLQQTQRQQHIHEIANGQGQGQQGERAQLNQMLIFLFFTFHHNSYFLSPYLSVCNFCYCRSICKFNKLAKN